MADDGDLGLSATALQAIVDGVVTKLQETACSTLGKTTPLVESEEPRRTANVLDGKFRC